MQNNNEKPQKQLMQFHKLFESIVSSRLYVSLILFLVSFTIFAPSLNNDFVWDDIVYIKENIERLKDYSPGLSKLIPRKKENKATGYVGIWRPVLISSWALDSKLWGLSSFGFHLSNIVLHCVSTVLMFLFCSMILSRFNIAHGIKISGLAGLVFAVHPVHVETVSFISARSDLLCAVFILLAMIFLVLSYNKLYLLLASFPFFYLALLSKETAIVVPLLALCLVLLI
ncbi:MAG: hypothetical protein GTN59_10660, partial [Candidatus Dadabacteria bacterium]|nr:hypothetical protein [Candidatus Dadabacteria bacterium]